MSWYRDHKKATWIGVSAVVVVLLAGGTIYFVHAHEEQKAKEKKQAKKKAGPVRVRIVHPKEGGVERLVTRPGSVQSFEYAELYSKVSGYLENQEVDIGSHVKKDEVLATVFAPEKHKDVEKAAADLRKAKANLEAVKAHLNQTQADQMAAQSRYEQSKADLKKAQAMVSLRRKQYRRYYGLAQDKAIQQELVDEKMESQLAAEAAESAAEKAVATALSELGAAKAAVVAARADVLDADADVGVAKAVLDRAEVFAKYTKIPSPYTGVITLRNFHNGDFIRDAAGGGAMPKPVLAVARTDKMRVIIYVPDQAVPYLKVGDVVKLDIDALPDHDFEGKIARLAYTESLESRTMRAEVDMENPNDLLKAGMYGKMIIHLGREDGVRIPSTALSGKEENDERSVFVLRDDRVHKVKVRIGIDDGIEATVRDGLSASDAVVAERTKGLNDGTKVKVIGEGLEKSSIEQKGQEDKRIGGKKSSSKSKKSKGKSKEESKKESQKSNAKSNFTGGRESQNSSTQSEKERKEFERSGGKEGSRRKTDSGDSKKK
ncbi:MAG: efflux RND transporter periplasmic adaptor subunit [Gemmataceae bacterium]